MPVRPELEYELGGRKVRRYRNSIVEPVKFQLRAKAYDREKKRVAEGDIDSKSNHAAAYNDAGDMIRYLLSGNRLEQANDPSQGTIREAPLAFRTIVVSRPQKFAVPGQSNLRTCSCA
ncbi:uncharacterized protein FOMMEDRAFT_160340 [Fomitiporia mediterranea MF3/22]|uniref:uncharacterized protein n=1 Tax=Fomitiporia mediterranea (strain MF3/22) TaxID=694068 RepID=UPI0004408EE8|nr:uncharacterized protein FOMMEDRAFT_160340 [Fomitiporia mediterranea MF3/22]EJC99885.1 hypothetical protein FOMMEDRAFT_160340 [Fomitiporia mediterranea MF3/22]